ncbi:MAG: hypothetical protein AAFY16_02075 [Cyanobacteria bacterium J06642_3]
MEKDPVEYVSGSAFNGNTMQATRPITTIAGRDKTNYVSLSDWCVGNFISKDIGYILIKRKLLIGQRIWGQWWVCANPDCYDVLLDYLGVEQLIFDADNEVFL